MEYKLERLKSNLKRYHRKKMPADLQEEITANWNKYSLWLYTDYSGVYLKKIYDNT